MGKDSVVEKPSWWDSLTCGEKLRAFDAPPSWRFEDLTLEQREEISSALFQPADEWENPEELFKEYA